MGHVLEQYLFRYAAFKLVEVQVRLCFRVVPIFERLFDLFSQLYLMPF
jgi:hypothetical protein